MARNHPGLVALLLLAATGTAAAGLRGDGIQQRHEQLQQLDDALHATMMSEEARGQALAARFRELYPDAGDPGALHASDEASLHLRFDDAMLANFYRTEPYALDAMQASLAELEHRGAAKREELARMRNALLSARRFDDAAKFGASRPKAGLAALPKFVDAGNVAAGQPSAWREAVDGRFERIALDLGPPQVLVMAGCHFSDDAAREISADPVLGPAFRAHATWLGLPPGPEDPADVAEWNRAHPQAPMLTLYDRAEWPMFPQWRMPSFYVVRDGRIMGTVIGWKPADARDALVALLRKNGLLSSGQAVAPGAPGNAAGNASEEAATGR
ncbi:MAG TPA: hypothetical protein VL118_04530 [Luteimonas sp.]|nr:hypothetical protein [Luteimonas sp.]